MTLYKNLQASILERMEEIFMDECLEQRGTHRTKGNSNKSGSYGVGFGQMTVYRLQLECICRTQAEGETCAQFLKTNSVLSPHGEGVYKTKS